MSYVALLIVAYIALSRIQRVVWALHRLMLAVIVAGLAWGAVVRVVAVSWPAPVPANLAAARVVASARERAGRDPAPTEVVHELRVHIIGDGESRAAAGLPLGAQTAGSALVSRVVGRLPERAGSGE